MIQTSDEGYVVSGWTSALKGFNGLSSYMFLIKLVLTNMHWNSSYEGLGDSNALFVVQTDTSGYTTAGTTRSAEEYSHYDIWFAQLDPSGVLKSLSPIPTAPAPETSPTVPEFTSTAVLALAVITCVVALTLKRRQALSGNRLFKLKVASSR